MPTILCQVVAFHIGCHLGVELRHKLGTVGGDQGAMAGDALPAEARSAYVGQLPPQAVRHLVSTDHRTSVRLVADAPWQVSCVMHQLSLVAG